MGVSKAKQNKTFGGEGRDQRKAAENIKLRIEKKINFGEGAVATRKAMLEIYNKDKTESFEMVRAFLDWLENAYAVGLEYKNWEDNDKKGASPEDVDVWRLFIMDDRDLKTVYTLSSGAGGQNVQKNATAVDVTHVPTTKHHTCQNERSQSQNEAKAKENLLEDLVSYIGNVKSSLIPGEKVESGIRRVFGDAILKKTVGMERSKKARLEQILGLKFESI